MAETKQTFAQLGIPFPLFEAPIEESGDYAGIATCSLCRSTQSHCFEPGIGDDVVVLCSYCGTANGLDAQDRVDIGCSNCGQMVAFPSIDGELLVCYQCLRAGKATLGKDTELGMVGWEQAN